MLRCIVHLAFVSFTDIAHLSCSTSDFDMICGSAIDTEGGENAKNASTCLPCPETILGACSALVKPRQENWTFPTFDNVRRFNI